MPWSSALVSLLSEAEVGRVFPAPHVMVRAFVRQEAVFSSRIEGTRTTLEELLTYEATQLSFIENSTDTREVQDYVRIPDLPTIVCTAIL